MISKSWISKKKQRNSLGKSSTSSRVSTEMGDRSRVYHFDI